MSSREDDIMSLLGLNTSDSEPEELGDNHEEEDPTQQSGGAIDFIVERFVDRRSDRMGVQERHFNTRLRQRGNFIPRQNITQALQDGLRRAVDQVLTTTTDLHDEDRLYFTIASNRLHNNFQGWGLRAGE